MSYKIISKLPVSTEIKEKLPLSQYTKNIKELKDKEIADIINGKSSKMLLIVGPCSIDAEENIIKYANELAKIQEEVKDKLLIVLRAYTAKARTSLKEYKGVVHSPDLFKSENITLGIGKARKIQTRIINETGLIIADELLYTDLYCYIDDIVSYIAIGARSVENQQHRLIASAVSQAIGFKNPINGNIENVIETIASARNKNHCIFNEYEIEGRRK